MIDYKDELNGLMDKHEWSESEIPSDMLNVLRMNPMGLSLVRTIQRYFIANQFITRRMYVELRWANAVWEKYKAGDAELLESFRTNGASDA